MKKYRFYLFLLFFISHLVHAGGDDNPLLAKVMLNEIQTALHENKPSSLRAQAWLGKDLDKFWLKTQGEYQNSDDKELEVQALYSRAISPYWDAQIGAKVDMRPSHSRHWAVFGLQGLAPYYFEIDTALFIGEEGRSALRLSAEHDMLITQKLILTPEIKTNLYGKNDAEMGIGAGFSDINMSLKLRYELIREFAPYIAIEWQKKFGNTAKYARAKGESSHDTILAIGFRAWF